jgi:hypothetical protein
MRCERAETKFSLLCPFSWWQLAETAIGDRCKYGAGQTDAAIYFAWLLSLLSNWCALLYFPCDALSPLARPPLMRSACICGRQTKRGPVVNWNEFCKRKLKWSQFPDCGGLHCSQLPGQNGTRHKQTLNTHSEYLALYCCLRKNIKRSFSLIFLILL